MLTEKLNTTPLTQQNVEQDRVSTAAAVVRVMEALTTLLVGDKGDARGPAFNREMMVIVGGPLPLTGLNWLSGLARHNQRHVLHLAIDTECRVPTVALAYRHGERVTVYERCVLTLGAGDDRVTIVPEDFRHGGFRLTHAQRLKRRVAPASFEAAGESIVRAFDRFYHLLEVAPVADRASLPILT